MGRRVVLVLTLIVGAVGACTSRASDEDERRSGVLAEDPLATGTIAGVTFESIDVDPGHGDGPSTASSYVRRTGRGQGEPKAVMRELVGAATSNGWTIYSIDCSGTTIAIVGDKVFGDFVGSLVALVIGSGPESDVRITLEATHADRRATTKAESPRRDPVDVAGSCIAGGP